MKKKITDSLKPHVPYYTIYWALGIVLLFGAFLRFYNFTNRYSLGNETVRDAFVGLIGARELQAPLTGPFSSMGPFTFGPWYWYHLIVGSLILRTAYAPWVTLALMSTVYPLVLFLIGKEVRSPLLGLLMAAFAALSPEQIIGALHLTNPNMLHVYAALTVYTFMRLVSRRESWVWGLLFGTAWGIAVNMHYEALDLGVLAVFILFWSHRPLRQILAAAGGFFMVNIPILVFNLLNHWQMIRNMVYVFLHGKELIYVANSWTIYVGKFWPVFWADMLGVHRTIGIVLAAASVIALGYEIFLRRNRALFRFTAPFVVIAIALRYYWGERNFSYFNFVQPFSFLFAALPFTLLFETRALWKHAVAFVALVGLFVVIVPRDVTLLESSKFVVYMGVMERKIEEAFPQQTVMMYNCENDDTARDFSVAFLLYQKNKLGSNGVRVGFSDKKCLHPSIATDFSALPMDQRVAQYIEPNANLREIGAVNLTDASPSAIASRGFVALTPRFFYDHNVKWWYDEKP